MAVDIDKKYIRSSFVYNYGEDGKDLYFSFELGQDMDTVELDFAISVA